MFEKEASQCSYYEFLAYLLLYAASADLEVSDEEQKAIENKIGEKTFNEAYNTFKKWSDYERLQFILSSKARFIDSPQKRYQILDEIKEIFKSDNDYNYMERIVMRNLEKIL